MFNCCCGVDPNYRSEAPTPNLGSKITGYQVARDNSHVMGPVVTPANTEQAARLNGRAYTKGVTTQVPVRSVVFDKGVPKMPVGTGQFPLSQPAFKASIPMPVANPVIVNQLPHNPQGVSVAPRVAVGDGHLPGRVLPAHAAPQAPVNARGQGVPRAAVGTGRGPVNTVGPQNGPPPNRPLNTIVGNRIV